MKHGDPPGALRRRRDTTKACSRKRSSLHLQRVCSEIALEGCSRPRARRPTSQVPAEAMNPLSPRPVRPDRSGMTAAPLTPARPLRPTPSVFHITLMECQLSNLWIMVRMRAPPDIGDNAHCICAPLDRALQHKVPAYRSKAYSSLSPTSLSRWPALPCVHRLMADGRHFDRAPTSESPITDLLENHRRNVSGRLHLPGLSSRRANPGCGVAARCRSSRLPEPGGCSHP